MYLALYPFDDLNEDCVVLFVCATSFRNINIFLVRGEPSTYRDALSSDDATHWNRAMEKEMDSLHKNYTWVLTQLPPNRNPN